MPIYHLTPIIHSSHKVIFRVASVLTVHNQREMIPIIISANVKPVAENRKPSDRTMSRIVSMRTPLENDDDNKCLNTRQTETVFNNKLNEISAWFWLYDCWWRKTERGSRDNFYVFFFLRFSVPWLCRLDINIINKFCVKLFPSLDEFQWIFASNYNG